MIDTAKELGGKTKPGGDVEFVISAAEEISQIKGLELGSVDLLTSAMAAHWFDMTKFWAEAAKVVKPGGTVALWTCSSSFCHPSTPNAAKVMEILFCLERETLAPYELPGNRISMNMYDDLPLPWNVSRAAMEFPQSQYVKHEYDWEGMLSNGVDFFNGGTVSLLDQVEKGLGTASMVTRWRTANPELAGTDKDALKLFVREVREALGGPDWFLTGNRTTILLFKKSS